MPLRSDDQLRDADESWSFLVVLGLIYFCGSAGLNGCPAKLRTSAISCDLEAADVVAG